MKIPEQYLPVMPYIITARPNEFVLFLTAAFDAKEQLTVPAEDGSIIHGEYRIHDAVIMFGGATSQFKEHPCGMFLYVEDVDNVYTKALANGGQSLHAPVQQEYGYTAGFSDPFNNQWWIVQGE